MATGSMRNMQDQRRVRSAQAMADRIAGRYGHVMDRQAFDRLIERSKQKSAG